MKTNPAHPRSPIRWSAITAIAAAVIAFVVLPAVTAIGDIEEGGIANGLFLVQVVVIVIGLAATGFALRTWRRGRLTNT